MNERIHQIYLGLVAQRRKLKLVPSQIDIDYIESCCPESAIGILGNKTFEYKVNWLEKNLDTFLADQKKLKESGNSVICLICGFTSSTLFGHIKAAHKITATEYKNKFGPGTKTLCDSFLETLSKRVSGNKNPAYNHGGRLSPFSEKFVKYQELSEDDMLLAIKTVSAFAVESTTNDKRPTCIEYYLAKGYSQEESEKLLVHRQITFSLDICVEKYGVMLGTKVFFERQNKWQNTLQSKSDEETKLINSKKIRKSGTSISKQETILKNILELEFNAEEVETQYQLKYYDKEKLKNKFFMYDIKIGNVIIEYNGDFWHRNPKKYGVNDELNQKGFLKVKTADIWNRDALKKKVAEENCYYYYVVWENDFKQNQSETVSDLIKFIKKNYGN